MNKIKRRYAISRLGLGAFIEFCKEITPVIEKFGLMADAAKITEKKDEMTHAKGGLRRNYLAAKSRAKIKELKTEVAILGKYLSSRKDHDSQKAAEIYDKHVKGKLALGFAPVTSGVEVFIEATKNLTFDEISQKLLDNVKQLQDDSTKMTFASIDETIRLNNLVSPSTKKREVIQQLELVFDKIEVMDAENGSNHCKEVNDLIRQTINNNSH